MIILELVEITYDDVMDEVFEKVKAVSTSHSSLVKYCKNQFSERPLLPGEEPENFYDQSDTYTRYKIRQSHIVIIPESMFK